MYIKGRFITFYKLQSLYIEEKGSKKYIILMNRPLNLNMSMLDWE